MQLDAFRRAAGGVGQAVPCLVEPLTPVDAAAVHRVAAYRAFVDDDREAALAAFRAVRELTPAWRRPTSLATEDNPLRILFDEAVEKEGPTATIDAPPGAAYLLVDGRRKAEHYLDRPALLQVVDPSGAITWTGLLQRGVSAPDWVALGLAPAPDLALDAAEADP
ncbi:MAG: hypothetical protein D6798_11825, partial [Deltaproteobacteria bacterium]